MTQSEPHIIDAGDMPEYVGHDSATGNNLQGLMEDLIETVSTPTEPTPAGPKATYRHLLAKAQTSALQASEHAYEACDWFALFDKPTADRYRKSARHLYELSEHLTALIEES